MPREKKRTTENKVVNKLYVYVSAIKQKKIAPLSINCFGREQTKQGERPIQNRLQNDGKTEKDKKETGNRETRKE